MILSLRLQEQIWLTIQDRLPTMILNAGRERPIGIGQFFRDRAKLPKPV